jgi:FlaA1/EpsC-like NDP-sugar epimerase
MAEPTTKTETMGDTARTRAERQDLFLRFVTPWRRSVGPVVDSLAWIAAILTASLLRFEGNSSRAITAGLFLAIGIAVVAQLVLGSTVLYRRQWRICSFEEILALSLTVTAVGAVLLAVSLLTLRHDLPVGVVLAASAFTLVVTAGSRSVWRLAREYRHEASEHADKVIVFGAGDAGRQVIDTLSTPDSPYTPVALLDDDPGKRHLQIRTLRVGGGRAELAHAAKRTNATILVIAIPSADSQLIRELSTLAGELDLDVRVLPPVSRLFATELGVEDIRPVTDADLLGRHAVDTEIELIAEYLTGRRVLVTGAGGSIGSELCRQIHQFAPSELVMLDRDESGLHQTQLAIEGRAMLNTRSMVVCDIRDAAALHAVFDEHRPEVVFHAAALKHLPLLEMWPSEAIKTNIFGTLNVLEAAASCGTEKVVNISTDKAANPGSVLGYTKRLAERLTAEIGKDAPGSYLSVRFGNVLGSRGSVLTAFRAQVEAGGPVTVTDPNVTRFFMTVEEAVQLTVQAGALGKTGQVMVLDMGDPVRIAEVAERLVSESRRPVRIVYTGLRLGEKLHEDLFGDDETDRHLIHPLISSTSVPRIGTITIGDLPQSGSPDQVKLALAECCVLPEGEWGGDDLDRDSSGPSDAMGQARGS